MLLTKIKEVRVKQVYFDPIYEHTYVINSVSNSKISYNRYENGIFDASGESNELGHVELIGLLGVTHKLVKTKIVEIPRKEYSIDDIYEHMDNYRSNLCIVIKPRFKMEGTEDLLRIMDFLIVHSHSSNARFYKRVGVLGVTHEFINERLA